MNTRKFILIAICIAFIFSLCVPATAFPILSGDANGDGKLNAADVRLLLRRIADSTVVVSDSADYNGDGKLNVLDVTLLMKYLVGYCVATDSLLEAKYGVEEVGFEIPDPICDKEVSGSQFGFDPDAADNSSAFNAAAKYLSENPGTVLKLEKGTYRMGAAVVSLSSIKNCTIDGNGATLLFNAKRYFSISRCEGLKIENLTIDWDWDTTYLASIAKVTNITGPLENGRYSAEFKFIEEDASYALNQNWDSMIYLDPETLTMGGVAGKGDIFNVNDAIVSLEQTKENVIKVTMANREMLPDEGATVLIRHENYGSTMFPIRGQSSNIVFEDVTIYGVAGCGIVVSDGSHHVRMTRLYIGLNPATEDKHRISTTADAIHIKDTMGYYILEDSEISFNGDDCMNIHDNVGTVTDFYDDTVVVWAMNTTAFNVGDTLSFRHSSDFSKSDFTAVITERSVVGKEYTLTLDRDCEDDLEEGMIVHDMTQDSGHYIVRNCYFHENRARALLLGSSNALVENCRFYRQQLQAITVPIDIIPSLWQEGKGTDNIIIRNNTFDGCNKLGVDDGSCISIFATTSTTPSGVLMGNCFENILISGNVFRDLPGYLIKAVSVRNLTVYGNTIEFPESENAGYSAIKSGMIFLRGSYYDESHIIGNTWKLTDIAPENFEPFKINPSKISKIVTEQNTITK